MHPTRSGTALATACPAFDAAAVIAAASQRAARGTAEPGPWGIGLSPPDAVDDAMADRARFERLLGDLRLD